MPRLRQPTAKKEELFDSTLVQPETEGQDKPVVGAAPAPEKPFQQEETKVKEPEKQEDEASAALKKQLDKIRESEALAAQAMRERDEVTKRLREQELERAKAERKAVQAEYLTVSNTLASAKRDLEAAERDLDAAENSGDVEAKRQAIKRMVSAQAQIIALEPGRDELKDKRRAEKKKVRELRDQVQQPQQQAHNPQAAPHVTEWTRAHSDYFDGGLKQKKLYSAFWQASAEGLEDYSPAMLERMDQILGSKAQSESQPQQRTNIVSAPVSREVPSANRQSEGRTTLTAEEREAARVSGITEAEYARQKMKYRNMVASGEYGDRR